MKKSKLYTKTGDSGETGLVSGKRISKADDRIDLYGDLDELNARVGMSCSLLAPKKFKATISFLRKLQSCIFDLGSNLACEAASRAKFKLPQISSSMITKLEKEIDRLDAEVDPLKNFILPGGSPAASSIHLCRTGARSVERKLVRFHLSSGEELPENALVFLNRLSDYFFALSRYVNKLEKKKEIVWSAQ